MAATGASQDKRARHCSQPPVAGDVRLGERTREAHNASGAVKPTAAAREGGSTAIAASHLASPAHILSMTPPAHTAQTGAAAMVPAAAML